MSARPIKNITAADPVVVSGGSRGLDMMLPQRTPRYTSWMRAYAEGYACHGDLGLDAQDYCHHLETIVQKHLGPKSSPSAVAALFEGLHKADLYLSMACARHNQTAWERFLALYGDYIQAIARFMAQTRDMAIDLACNLPGHLFLPDRSGRSRIASYDGQTRLATWLRVIITRQALNERERQAGCPESFAEAVEVVDELGLHRIESGMRTAKYAAMVEPAFAAAVAALSPRERLIICWKYKDGLSSDEIARQLDVHPSTVSRQFRQAYKKLARESARLLQSQYRLSAAAVEECLKEAREGPGYSLLAAIEKEAGPAAA